jgi:hypothetical protein
MPANLTITSVHINKPLTNLARGYTPPGFIAERVFPVVTVEKEADSYFQFGKEDLQADEENTLRADGALASEFSWDVTNTSYLAHEYAKRQLITDRIVRNADPQVQPSINTTKKLKSLLMLAQEKRVQAIAQSAAVFTNTAVPAIKWDQATATIQADVNTAKETVLLNAGVMPNAWLMNFQTANDIMRWLKNQAQTTFSEWLSKNMLPPVLWGLETIVGEAVENTANPEAAETLAYVWTDNSLIFHKQPSPTLQDRSAGYILRAQDWEVKTYREEARKGNWHECSVIEDEVTIDASCGYLWTDVLT